MAKRTTIPPCPLSLLAVLAPCLTLCAGPIEAQLALAREHRVLQNQTGGAIEAGDGFGGALAAGDFDGDGFLDLAIGTPEEDPGAVENAGAVYVVYGTASGLNGTSARAPVVLDQDQYGVGDRSGVDDRFGAALAVGNFDGDAYDDLAVGIPGEDSGSGAIQIFYGSSAGIDPIGDDFEPAPSDTAGAFGAALAAGAVNTDAYDELLVGAPEYSTFLPSIQEEVGSIALFYGSSGGLDFDTPGIASGIGAAFDHFGSAVGIGHVNNDGGDAELLVGAPFADAGGPADEGIVYIIDVLAGIGGGFEGAQEYAHMGTALVVDDFFGAGFPQVLVGVPGGTITTHAGTLAEAGGALLYSPGFLLAILTQGGSLPETPEPYDRVGEVLGSGDFDGDGRADAVLGVPSEDVGALVDAGVVQLVYGNAFASGASFFQLFTAEDFGDVSEADARLGAAVTAGDFDGDGADDLAIGIPGATVNGLAESGTVQILYGTPPIFLDGFESGDTSAWSS